MRFAAVILSAWLSAAFAAEYHVDARVGSDAYPGTKERPFATIQKAAEVMQPGDVCRVHEGIYRETVRPPRSGAPGAPLRFEAWNGEEVTITGTERISAAEWKPFEGPILTAEIAAGKKVTQLFVNGRQMEVARFPNNTSDDLLAPTLGVAASAVARQKPSLSELMDPLLAQAPNLKGGELWLLSGLKWISFTQPITDHQGDRLQFVFSGDVEEAYRPQAGSEYFVTGLLSLVDAEKEWFFDAKARRLYFYPPSGPADAEVRTRQWGLDLSGRSEIEVKGIRFFAASILMEAAVNCLVEDCRIFYPTPFFPTDGWAYTENPQNSPGAGVKVGGRGNTLRNCEVAYSWGDAVTVYGQENTVENCLIHDFAWVCSDAAGVHTSGRNHTIIRNSIYNGARCGIVHRKSQGLEIAYNDIYRCGLLCTDLGATYCWQTDGGGTVIHHNWVHDVVTKAHTAGIYLDNGSSNFIVHHNVVWNTDDLGIQTNLDAVNHQIYHNTIWNCAQAMGGGGGTVHRDCRVYNNLSNAAGWFGTDVRQNPVVGDARFVDELKGDFRLQADSPARDDYVLAAAFLNGGFESGVGGWSGAGSSLESITEPVHSGLRACRSYDRRNYWEGVRQNITEVLKECGRGSYTIEAWMMPASGTIDGYLRFKLVDEAGESYPGVTRRLTPGTWTKLSYKTTLNWKGELKEAVFELMTSNDKLLPDLYIDDCALITPPPNPDPNKPRGAVLIPGINDDAVDGKPDAGAYEYGGPDADWRAGSSLKPAASSIREFEDRHGSLPDGCMLLPNYPNPFNRTTVLRFRTVRAAEARLTVHDLLGRPVRTLLASPVEAGEISVPWDGRADDGLEVGSGVYLCTLELKSAAGTVRQSRKAALIK